VATSGASRPGPAPAATSWRGRHGAGGGRRAPDSDDDPRRAGACGWSRSGWNHRVSARGLRDETGPPPINPRTAAGVGGAASCSTRRPRETRRRVRQSLGRCPGVGGRLGVARPSGAEDGGRPRPAVARTRGRRMAHAPRAGRRARGAGHAGRRALACPRGRRPLRAWRRARRPGCPRGPGRPGVESGVARNGDLRAPVTLSPRRGASQSGVYGTYCGNQIAASTAASSWSSRYARPVPASRACRATSVAIACETFRRSPAGG
jgi:hypothetical protein